MDFVFYEYEKKQLDINIDFCGREACLPNYSFGPSIRENYVLHFILDGSGCLHIDGDSIDLAAGDCFVLPKDHITFYQANKQTPWEYVWIGIGGTKVEEFLQRSSLLDFFYLKNIAHSAFIKEFILLVDLSENVGDSNIDLLMDSQIYKLLYILADEFPSTKQIKKSQKELYFLEAIKYIANYFNRAITVTHICSQLNLSRSYLYAIFKAQIGYSPQQYLLRFRMKKASDLLVNTSNTVTMIASSVGYNDPLNFSKAFKSYYGQSATEYRVNHTDLKQGRRVFSKKID